MKRRRFLHLAASAAAGVVIQHSSASAAWRTSPADVLSLAVDHRAPAAFVSPRVIFGARTGAAIEPGQLIEMLLEKSSDGAYRWTVDGQSTQPLLLQQGRRYRLRMMNATNGVHSVSLRHHTFEVTRMRQVPVSGILKDALVLERFDVVEADVLMSRSGPFLLQYTSS